MKGLVNVNLTNTYKYYFGQATHKRTYGNEREREKGQEEMNKSLLREAESFSRLADNEESHENIVDLRFCCTSKDFGEFFLGLELCKGKFYLYIVHFLVLLQILRQQQTNEVKLSIDDTALFLCGTGSYHLLQHW